MCSVNKGQWLEALEQAQAHGAERLRMQEGGIGGSGRLQPLAEGCSHDDVAQQFDEFFNGHFGDLNVILRGRVIANSLDECDESGRQRGNFAQLPVNVTQAQCTG